MDNITHVECRKGSGVTLVIVGRLVLPYRSSTRVVFVEEVAVHVRSS